MNDAFIKKIVKQKLKLAGEVIDCLPPKTADEIKHISQIVLESINESLGEMKEKPSEKTRPSDRLDSIPIE